MIDAGLATLALLSGGVPPVGVEERFGDDLPVARPLADSRWFETEWGWIAAADPIDAYEAAEALGQAASLFYQRFGEPPPRGAIVQAEFAGVFDPLTDDGRAWVLPWQFAKAGAEPPSETATALALALTDAGYGGPPSAMAELIEARLSDSRCGRDMDQPRAVRQRSSIRHELGHLFLMSAFLPNTRPPQYGGDAPDWLDEAAAVAMETPAVLRQRRAHFAGQIIAGRVKPLLDFVVDEHPLYASRALQALVEEAQSREAAVPIVLEVRLQEVDLDEDSIADFYAQSLATVDFLAETTRDSQILGRIARDIRDTGDPTGWLGRIPPRPGQPDAPVQPAEWEAAFREWKTRPGRLAALDDERRACPPSPDPAGPGP
ncbi:hypothetical protein FKB34_05680 [Glycocaulis profundi]|nr:hypothetical protein FKB34_05680 [Glycocaulis profundi]